jgi:hypothetical protein
VSEPCRHERDATEQGVWAAKYWRERQAVRAEVEDLTLDLEAANATIERVRALVGALVEEVPDPKDSTHWDVCHLHHRDCLVLAVRAALEPTS